MNAPPTPTRRGKPAGDPPASPAGDRIAKVIARAGLCSRRDAERWIAEGRITLDGKVLTSPALNVPPGADIRVDGRPLPEAPPPRLWRFHKTAGLVTTRRDPEGRPTVFEHLPADFPHVLTVGRLDIASEGLLLLVNDGALARHIELPATGWTRRYRVRVHGRVDERRLQDLAHGVTIDGAAYGPIEAAIERQQGANAWLKVALKEGKNREIRKVLESLGYPVNRLIRISFGPFQLGTLVPGQVAELKTASLRSLLPAFFPKRPHANRRR